MQFDEKNTIRLDKKIIQFSNKIQTAIVKDKLQQKRQIAESISAQKGKLCTEHNHCNFIGKYLKVGI